MASASNCLPNGGSNESCVELFSCGKRIEKDQPWVVATKQGGTGFHQRHRDHQHMHSHVHGSKMSSKVSNYWTNGCYWISGWSSFLEPYPCKFLWNLVLTSESNTNRCYNATCQKGLHAWEKVVSGWHPAEHSCKIPSSTDSILWAYKIAPGSATLLVHSSYLENALWENEEWASMNSASMLNVR